MKSLLMLSVVGFSILSGPLVRPLSADEVPPSTPPAKATVPSSDKGYKDVEVTQFDQLRTQEPKPIVLDVRTPEEFAAGHIQGSKNLDFLSPNFPQDLAALSREKTYLVHCAAGGRSAKACKQMTKLGFTHVVNLKGGFEAWKTEGKPVEK